MSTVGLLYKDLLPAIKPSSRIQERSSGGHVAWTSRIPVWLPFLTASGGHSVGKNRAGNPSNHFNIKSIEYRDNRNPFEDVEDAGIAKVIWWVLVLLQPSMEMKGIVKHLWDSAHEENESVTRTLTDLWEVRRSSRPLLVATLKLRRDVILTFICKRDLKQTPTFRTSA